MNKIFLLFFVLVVSNSYSQDEKQYVDSILNTIIETEIDIDNFDLLKELCKEAEKVSEKVVYNEGIFRSNMILAQAYRDFHEDSSMQYIHRMEDVLKVNSTEVSEGYIMEYFLLKGYLEGNRGRFEKELKYYLKADSICKKNDFGKDEKIYISQHIGSYYYAQGEYNKALSIFKEIHNNQKSLGIPDEYGYSNNLSNIGIIYSHLNEPQKTVEFINNSISTGLGNYTDLHYQYLILSTAYLKLELNDSARIYLEKAKPTYENKYGASIDLVNYYTVYGDYYKETKNYKRAHDYFKQAAVISDSLNYIIGINKSYDLMVQNALIETEEEELIHAYRSLKNIKDSIYKRSTIELERKYLVEYETIEKEARIHELELENEIDKQRSLAIISIVIALLIIALLFLWRTRVKRTLAKSKLELQRLEKEKVEYQLKQKERELRVKIEMLKENMEIIEKFKESSSNDDQIKDILNTLKNQYINETQWDDIILQFNTLFNNYLRNLQEKIPSITRNDIKIAILMKLGFSNQSMVDILNISYEGVKKAKQRYKKKKGLGIEN